MTNLIGCAHELTREICKACPEASGSLTFATDRRYAKEIIRYGAVEMHNIAAIIGGIAAQEVVKLLVRQCGPLNNTYVFNGIACVGAKYEM